MISRRGFLRKGLAAGAASVVSGCLSEAQGIRNTPTKSRPNIIFIFADDWGYGDMGIHGSPFCKTPHLDRMAKEGIDFQQSCLFTQPYSSNDGAVSGSALCSPTFCLGETPPESRNAGLAGS